MEEYTMCCIIVAILYGAGLAYASLFDDDAEEPKPKQEV